MATETIRLRGIRQNNLKGFDLDIAVGQLVVVTGRSGSGKSSLAFETLFAEGQRRYIETFSPYARQFFDRMDKPRVDRIEGIPPAIAVEQKNSVKSTRSTVGTMTEICDHMKSLWRHVARLHCRGCGKPVQRETVEGVYQATLKRLSAGTDILVTFDVPRSERLSLEETAGLISQQGYRRLLIDEQPVGVEEAPMVLKESAGASITIIQDRLSLGGSSRKRFLEACEQAYHLGKGQLAIRARQGASGAWVESGRYSAHLHCAGCNLSYRDPSPALFSFNNPVGACPTCRGFGRVIGIDMKLVIPEPRRTLREGVVKPWQTGQGEECQRDLLRYCKLRSVPLDVPFEELPADTRGWIVNGDPGYGTDKDHEWPKAWYGVRGYFKWLEGRAYKMHVRVLLSRYRSYSTCSACHGARFQPEALLYKASAGDGNPPIPLSEFYRFTVTQALAWVKSAVGTPRAGLPEAVRIVLGEVVSRLHYLEEVGLGYLTLDRATRTLSGGETERVNLTTCLGSSLTNTLYVLDEPTVGLHPRDTERLIGILKRLRDQQNTVVVVEHEAAVMRAADSILDLGPEQGEAGGELMFQGGFESLPKAVNSHTARHLTGRDSIPLPQRRPVTVPKPGDRSGESWLGLREAELHNLHKLTVEIPLRRFVCVTGVSGSGKTTLVREVLWPLLRSRWGEDGGEAGDSDEDGESAGAAAKLSGGNLLKRAVFVDQSGIGKTPRSNPAVYSGAFEPIRDLFASTAAAKRAGLGSSGFSFNSAQGQCEQCRGAGFEKIEMQFLSDVYVRCAACDGKRYRKHILELRLVRSELVPGAGMSGKKGEEPAWSISDLLEASVDKALEFLEPLGSLSAARKAMSRLGVIREVGLGYIRLGQPLNTLSGGEAQRLKLASHLAAFREARGGAGEAILLFDEPTTGLHVEDVRALLAVFQRLVDEGHSVVVVEHNLDVIKSCDWVIDLGPDAGADGGRVVAEGSPEQVAAGEGHTAAALRGVLPACGVRGVV